MCEPEFLSCYYDRSLVRVMILRMYLYFLLLCTHKIYHFTLIHKTCTHARTETQLIQKHFLFNCLITLLNNHLSTQSLI